MVSVLPKYNVAASPEFTLIREVSANDSSLPDIKSAGINCSDFDELIVMATLTASATAADVEPHFWSPSKDDTPANGGFINEATPQTINVGVNGVIQRIKVHFHDSVFLGVTGLTGAGSVRIEIAGIPAYGQKGI